MTRADRKPRERQQSPAHRSATAKVPVAPDAAGQDITFPQIARLELDDLLEQLVERAQDVLNTQSRLRGLLAATRAISADLSLPKLLRRITQSACDLVGARYGALGVVGPDQQLTEFITVGVRDSTVAEIGHLPKGRGILGSVIFDPVPLRLQELGKHPQSVGFPAGHPPMGSFLGVPIHVGDQIFGNLYLTEKTPGSAFTAEDEELVSALAAAAGIAIDNARLYEAERRRQLWLTASAEITRELLAGASDPLPLIAARARQVANADLATILVPLAEAPGMLLAAAADGIGADTLSGRLIPRDQSLAGRALAENRDLVMDDTQAELDDAGIAHRSFPLRRGPDGPVLLVRIQGAADGKAGVLSLSRQHGGHGFDRDEQEMVAGFADQAGVALELAQAQAARRRLSLFEDRDRIARDLHDHVIQRLFAAGLGLSALASRSGEPEVRYRLEACTEQLDAAIRAIRQSIFELHRTQETGVQAKVLEVARDALVVLGFTPDLRFEGPVDALVDMETADHVIGVVREALSNTARHAKATSVTVRLSVADGQRLTVTITDDGIGVGEHSRESGLANMRSRAETLGGTCAVTSPAIPGGGGTRVDWVVPLNS
jgi:signal transduction histidine kinase